MLINGKEVDFRISRLEDASRLELALRNMEAAEKKIKASKTKSLTEALKSMLDMLRKFFIDATGTDVLADCTDVAKAKEAYTGFLKDIETQKASVITFSLDDIK